jgi:hypothetical protein
MKKLTMILLAGGVAALLGAVGHAADNTTNAPTAAKVRIGTYDSRSLAIAYAGSAPFNQWLSGLKSQHDQAKAAGDQKRMAELEAEGKAGQKLLHMQGFSTAPVTNILDQIKDQLPAIKEQAHVEALVSKWDQAGLAGYPKAGTVDVTEALVDALHPTDRQRKSAIEIREHAPIPLQQAAHMDD